MANDVIDDGEARPKGYTLSPIARPAPTAMQEDDGAPRPKDYRLSEIGGRRQAPAPERPGMLSNNSEGDSWLSGGAKGAATAALKGPISMTAGFPAFVRDMSYGATDAIASGVDRLRGVPQEERDRHQQERDEFRKHNMAHHLPTTDEIYRKTAGPVFGEYEATSPFGRVGMAGVEALTSGNPVKAGAKAITAAKEAPAVFRGLGEVASNQGFRQAATDAAASTGKALKETAVKNYISPLSGVAAQGTYEATDNPYLAFGAGLLAHPAAHYGSKGISKFYEATPLSSVAAAVSDKEAKRLAAKEFLNITNDPKGTVEKLNDPETFKQGIENSPKTTGQLLGNQKILEAENEFKTKGGESFNGEWNTREAERNNARLDAIDKMAPQEANALNAVDALEARQAQIRQKYESIEQSLRQKAADEAAKLGQDADYMEIGERLRKALETAKQEERASVNALYKLVNPNDDLRVVTTPVQQAAEALTANKKKADVWSDDLQGVHDFVSNDVPAVWNFSELQALDQRLSDAISAERRSAGETRNLSGLVSFKEAVKDSINNAIKHQEEWEIRNKVKPEHRIATKLNETDPRAGDAAGSVGEGSGLKAVGQPGGELDGRSAVGETRPSNGGSGNAASSPGMAEEASAGKAGERPAGLGSEAPPKEPPQGAANTNEPPKKPVEPPNMTEEQAQKYAQANKEYGEYAQTYKKGPVGNVLASDGFKGQYKTMDSAVAGKAVKQGASGYQTAKMFIDAAKKSPEAIEAMKENLLNKFRGALDNDGMAQPGKFQRLRKDFDGAIKAIEEVSPGFSNLVSNPTKAAAELANFAERKRLGLDAVKKEAASRFLGLTNEVEVQDRIGALLNSKSTTVENVKGLINSLGGNKDALDGIRRAATDWILRTDTNSARLGVGQSAALSFDRIDKLLKNREHVLKEFFTPEQMDVLRAVHKDLVMENSSIMATRTKGQSATGKNSLNASFEKLKELSKTQGINLFSVASAAATTYANGATSMLPTLFAATAITGNQFRASGMSKIQNIVGQAVMDPVFARELVKRRMNQDPQTLMKVLTREFDNSLARSGFATENASNRKNERTKRASGGRIGKPMTPDQIIAGLERVRKAQQQQTEKILDKPDEAVVRALELANQHIEA
jgi:hypothetical protein